MEPVTDFILGGSKITADDDCSHEIKRCLLLGRKAMRNVDSILKSRDITLPTKVRLVKAMIFPLVMYGYESWTIKKAEWWRIDAFELWCWRRLLRVPWTANRSNLPLLKEIIPEYSLEGLMLKLKLQYFGHLMWSTDWLEKTLMLGKIDITGVKFSCSAVSDCLQPHEPQDARPPCPSPTARVYPNPCPSICHEVMGPDAMILVF